MKNKKSSSEKPANTALGSFRHDRSKNFMRNRFIALVIDFIIISLICQLAFTLFGTPDWARYLQTQELITGLSKSDPLVIERTKLYQECFIVSLAIGFLYEALMLLIFGASVGKLVFGFRVTDTKEGANFFVSKLLLVLRAALKMVSIYLLSALPFIFLCLAAFGNEEGRSGFDMLSRTKVVDVRAGRK